MDLIDIPVLDSDGIDDILVHYDPDTKRYRVMVMGDAFNNQYWFDEYKEDKETEVPMSHDYLHCADYCDNCPKDCFRAQITADLVNYPYPVSMANLKYTSLCKNWPYYM